MLVLTHTDGLGIDLHQLRQRVLQASRDGGGAPLSHVKIGKFLRGKLARRIHGSARFIYDHILHGCGKLLDQFHNHLLGFPGSGSVSYGNQGNVIFVNEALQLLFRFFHFILGRRRINHLRIQHLSRLVHHCQLTARAEGRVPAQHHLSRDRRLHEQLLQILSEHGNGAVLRFLSQVVSDFPLDGRRDQTVIAVRNRLTERGFRDVILPGDDLFGQILQNPLLGSLHLHGEEFFLFSTV